MKLLHLAAALGAVAGMAVHAVSAATLLPHDGRGGMTCYYSLAAARLAWQQPGGDWSDARGRKHGDEPYAHASVPRRKELQRVDWDVSSLVGKTQAGSSEPWVLFLRALPGGPTGTVQFFSREHGVALERPGLVVHWSDGVETRHASSADSHFSCPNHKASGTERVLRVGGQRGALLVFDIPPRTGHSVRRATLSLFTAKQHGAGASVGVFRAVLPSSDPGKVEQGLAVGSAGDRGLEQHPDVWLAERFDSGTRLPEWLSDKDAARVRTVTSDADNRFEALDGRALAVTLVAGSSQALNSHIRFAHQDGGEPEEAYFRYFLRLADNWNPTLDGGKLPGFSGTYGRGGWGSRRSDGSNGWSARGSFFGQGKGPSATAGLRAIGNYVYHADMKGRYGNTWGWNLGPTGLLQKNRWYSVEQHVRLNTPGKADGMLRAWIDGQLVFAKTDMRFRDSHALKIESVWMNVYHGGTRPAPHDLTLYIDNLVVARRYIGPAVWPGK